MSALANALIAVALAALLSAVQSQPSPGVATAGSSANSGAFSSSGTSLRPGPGGTGSFVAQSGFSQDSSSPYYRTAVSSSSPQGFASGYAGGYSSGGGYSTGGGISTGGGYSTGGGFPFPSFAPFPYTFFAPAQPFDFTSFFQNYISSIQRYHQQIAEAAKKAAAEHNQGGLAPQFPQSPDSFGNELGGPVGAAAFGQYGPQGGYGGAGVFPAPDNSVYNRFGGPVAESSGPFPPPGGSFYGVSSFSSSGQTDVNGKKTSYKQSAVTVNDNGKVTTYQAHDP